MCLGLRCKTYFPLRKAKGSCVGVLWLSLSPCMCFVWIFLISLPLQLALWVSAAVSYAVVILELGFLCLLGVYSLIITECQILAFFEL